jgi:hypothetical protein
MEPTTLVLADHVWRDVQHAIRIFVKKPTSMVMAILTLTSA